LACVDSVQLEQHSAERDKTTTNTPSTEPRPAADTARPEHTHIRRRTPTHRQLPTARGANPRLLLRFSPPPSKRQGCFSCSASIHVACHDPEHRTAPALDRPCKPFPSAEPAQPERLPAERRSVTYTTPTPAPAHRPAVAAHAPLHHHCKGSSATTTGLPAHPTLPLSHTIHI
jgi:hypothetical protein